MMPRNNTSPRYPEAVFKPKRHAAYIKACHDEMLQRTQDKNPKRWVRNVEASCTRAEELGPMATADLLYWNAYFGDGNLAAVETARQSHRQLHVQLAELERRRDQASAKTG
jgi:hypothetical protein